MAPEMFKGSFTERCDIWSLGVIAYNMMTGELPYKGDNLLMQAHIVCNPRKHPPWELLAKYKWSLGARWFCQQLLTKDEALRPSAQDALKDPWISKTSVDHANVLPTTEEKEALCGQHLQSHLEKMASACITSQLNLSQLHHLNDRFKQYDSSGDGRLGHVEMRQVLLDLNIPAMDVEHLIESLDSDHSGVIEYSEFVSGCIDISSDGFRKQLQVAFKIFDIDGSGNIGLDELRQVLLSGVNTSALPTRPSSARPSSAGGPVVAAPGELGSMLPDGKTVEEVMNELDTKHDGKISFAEFESYILEEHKKAGKRLTGATK
jgi:calcium-dependent protein kinase